MRSPIRAIRGRKEGRINKKNRRKKILVVDDDVNVLTVVSDTLKSFGFGVKTANNAQEAMKITDEGYPDLALIDLRMPEMDGIELMHRIKMKNPRIPVVICSGSLSVGTIIKAFREGAADYIPKPFDMHDFKLTVTNVFKDCYENKKLARLR